MWCTRGTCVEIATRSCCTASLYRSPRMSIRVMERMCCKRLRAGETARRGASRHCDDVGLHTHQNLAEAPPPGERAGVELGRVLRVIEETGFMSLLDVLKDEL